MTVPGIKLEIMKRFPSQSPYSKSPSPKPFIVTFEGKEIYFSNLFKRTKSWF